MMQDRPSPPANIDREIWEHVAALEERDADQLRALGEYLEALGAWKESRAETDDGATATDAATDAADGTQDEERSGDEYPDGVPERASVSIKEIAGTTYRYYQWRDGDRIESKTVEQARGTRE